MSFIPSGERANNISPNYLLYWCYQCHRLVRIASGDPFEIVCPRCFGQFLYEIDMERHRVVHDFTAFDPSPEARTLEALSLMFNPPIVLPNHRRNREDRFPDGLFRLPRLRNRGNDGGRMHHRDPETGIRGWFWPRRRTGMWLEDENDDWGPESGILARPRSWIILRPLGPIPTRGNQNPNEEGLFPNGVDPRNYFTGPGLQELVEQLTQNDRPGPPPLPDSAIDSIPVVQLTPSHLENDSECPVCKEKFDVGEEARELPCKHCYHSNCIVPWLRLHNSCPVCRHELPVPTDCIQIADSDESRRDSSSDGGGRSRRCPRLRQQLASFWPFRSSQTGFM